MKTRLNWIPAVALLLMIIVASAAGPAAAGNDGLNTADSEDPRSVVEHFAVPGSDGSLPFSDAARVGNLLFTAGKLGIPPGARTLVEGGIGPETRQTLENIKATVERHGSSMAEVVKCTVFLADMAEWPAMNEVYKTFFPNPPARSAVAVSGLALDARVEIECIAAVIPGS